RRSRALARSSTASRPRRRSGRRRSRVAKAAGSRESDPDLEQRLRALPSVEELAASLEGVPHALAVRAAREAIAARREALREGTLAERPDGPGDLRDEAFACAAAADRPSLRRVVNATGVIVHTNLGRAPLAPTALDAIREAA